MQTTALSLTKENVKLAAAHCSSQEERARQEEDHRETLNRDTTRRDKTQPPPTYQYLPIFDDLKEYLGYVEPIKIGLVISPEFPYKVKFDITSDIIQLLSLKDMFFGQLTNNASLHFVDFVGICTSYNLPRVCL